MIQQNKGDMHLFTTNHPWFLEIGLSSFTTGTLIDWWNQKTADGRYLNRRHINQPKSSSDPLSTAPNGLDKLLGISTGTEFFWEGWKPNAEIQNAGRFKKQNLKGALSNNGGSETDKWEYKKKSIINASKMIDLADNGILYTMGFTGTNEDAKYNTITQDINDPSILLQRVNPLYALIQLNKWMVLYQNYFPRKLWGADQDVLIPDWALVTEIKASKAGSSLQWSGPVKFYVDNGVFGQCEIEENIFFNLYLGNESMMKSGNNAITIKNLTIVGPKVDAFARTASTDGESTSVNTADPAAQTAAPLDAVWNPVARNWQSGNKNILAKLTTDLKKAINSPSVSHLITSDIGVDLNDPKNTNSFIPSSGSAMPINSQNSMPLQWAPNYANTKDARCSDSIHPDDRNKKLLVSVFNFNPQRSYPSGEMVLLTQMDNIWIVSSLGEANATPTDVVSTSVGKWGAFTYMATSSEFFFKGKINGSPVSVTPRSAELNFHKWYYSYMSNDRSLNYEQNYGLAGGYDSAFFDTSNHQLWTDEPGWFQTTSFDYLDSQIFGIRGKQSGGKNNENKCSISSTSATLNAAGKSILNEGSSSRNSAHTGTFFGCVFPAGYDGTDVYDDRNGGRSWTVGSSGIASSPDHYFTTNGINSNIINPFDPVASRNDSNAKCNATFTDPTGGIPSQGNLWSRGSTNADASLFYLGVNEGRKTIPADVMLNASPRGLYGSPIKPIGLFNFMNKDGAKNNPDIVNLVTGGVWLHKAPTTTTTTTIVNPNDSAFDFPPKQPDNLMFRPLKLEAYLQFGLPQKYITYGTENKPAENLFMSSVQRNVDGFYAEAARTQISKKFPISYYAPERENNNCSANLVGQGVGQPLKWGAWLTGQNKTDYGGRLHKTGYWNTSERGGGMNWTTKLEAPYDKISNWDGAGAFGVITTSNKVKANASIEFTTSNLYGMSASAGTSTRVDLGLLGSITFDQTQDKTWGVGNFVDSYKQAHIIDLSVRIYQGHDSSSTVYDPRYFAVHHFNPGVESLGVQTRPTGQVVFKDLKGTGNVSLNSVTYNYEQASGSVDFRIPSRYAEEFHTEGGSYNPVPLTTGTFVFEDATYIGEDKKTKIMPAQYWDVETKRTGKLLPYRYGFLTMTIPADIGESVSMILKSDAANNTVLESKNKLIIKNFGTGYNIGDTVGIQALNIVLKVANTYDGVITELQVVNNGENLPLSFCMDSEFTITNLPENLPFKVTTLLSSAGKGFDAYFVCAQVRAKIKCDPKPLLIKTGGHTGAEIVRIAANVAGPAHDTRGLSAIAESKSYVNIPGGATFKLTNNVKSADSTYDIFFHFHNDITMTWLACGAVQGENGQPHGDFNNPTESEEQHVTIESIKLT